VRDKVKDIAEGKYVDEAKDQLAYLEKRKLDLPSEITKLSAELKILKHEIEGLVTREKEIKAILTATKKEDEKDKPKETVKLIDGVLAPVPSVYKGVEPKIVDYIKSLPEPTSIDTDKVELRWIDEMRNLERVFVESVADVEVARQKLEQVYQTTELRLNSA
jgi:seryl-tRNA synthetase